MKPSLTEQLIMNPKAFDCPSHDMLGWRAFRIEYGRYCSCPEGIVYLPPDADFEKLETLLEELCAPKEAMR